jgi:uncharacterized protein (DUF1501 family)
LKIKSLQKFKTRFIQALVIKASKTMKRRDFLKNIPLATLPLMSNSLFANVASLPLINQTTTFGTASTSDNVLVIIQLEGGNDGLNTVLPLDQYSNLASARGNIMIPINKALPLSSFQTGLHPCLTGLKSLYDANRLCVVQGVGYNNPNRSHFRSTDIMLSGSDSNQIIDTGWAGRYLDYQFPGFPTGYPNSIMPDPPAIQIGATLSRGLMGANVSIGETIPWDFNGNITQLSNFINTVKPATYAGNEVSFLRTGQLNANLYANKIVTAWNEGGNATINYPTNTKNNIADQLKLVARLIKGGLKTKIYWVQMNGFDTHANQVDTSNTTQGNHATLLKDLSDSIYAFMTDCNNRGIDERVMGMTFSEFGRQIISNGSNGTDHGTVSSMFVFGKYVNPSVVGANPIIPANASWNTDITPQFDYRQVYASLLKGWFCVPQNNVASLLSNAVPIGITNTACLMPTKVASFNAEQANINDVHVDWIIANEINTHKFEIQRSHDSQQFMTISTVLAKGDGADTMHYDWLDVGLTSSAYYRLKTYGKDGNIHYSPIRYVNFEKKTTSIQAEVFPNPSQDGELNIQLYGNINSESVTEINIHDIYGRRVFHQEMIYTVASDRIIVNMGHDMVEGVYILDIRNEGQLFTRKVVIKK